MAILKIGGMPSAMAVPGAPAPTSSVPLSFSRGGVSFKTGQQTPEDKAVENFDLFKKKKDYEVAVTKDEKQKIPAAQLGYYTMARASVNDYKTLRDELTSKKLTYDDLRKAYAKLPTDQTSKINTILYSAADAWLRIQTGAQANPSEIQREADKYKPRPWDSNEAIDFKLKSLFDNRLSAYKNELEQNVGIKTRTPSPTASPINKQTKTGEPQNKDPLGVL